MKQYYAGIGSRDIPPNIKRIMHDIAESLSSEGYILRSGNATGSDQAFASGVKNDLAQIWLPWKEFEIDFQKEHPNHEYRLVGDECCPGEPDPEAWDSVKLFHPNYKKMKEGNSAKYYQFMRFMSRNYRQVRGWGEPDSRFVICWTHDGTDVGGTGQAIRIARHYCIPVFNLYNMTMSSVFKEIDKLNLFN